MTDSIKPTSQKTQKELLEKYVEAVLSAPHSLALTATRDPKEFWARHVLDALRVLEQLPAEIQKKTMRALDVGSGNGTPGIPIAIALPQWQVDLLDSNNKKCGFLDTFCKNCAIKNVRVLAGRAENFAHQSYREHYDLVFARALGKLPTTVELTAPFAKVGGSVIVPHGTSWRAELSGSKRAMDEVGLVLKNDIPYSLGQGIEFHVLIFSKYRPTPDNYPRAVGIPTKRPL